MSAQSPPRSPVCIYAFSCEIATFLTRGEPWPRSSQTRAIVRSYSALGDLASRGWSGVPSFFVGGFSFSKAASLRSRSLVLL